MRIIHKAKKGDYPAYAEMYMRLMPDDGNILHHLHTNFLKARAFISSLPEEKLYHRYEPGKWSLKEVLVHIIDDERIFAYRALCFARNEKQPLPGFDQDAYNSYAEADKRSVEGIFEEYESVRMSTITLFNNLPESALDRMGNGSGTFNGATARAMLYHIAGHEQHHMNIIKEKYLDS